MKKKSSLIILVFLFLLGALLVYISYYLSIRDPFGSELGQIELVTGEIHILSKNQSNKKTVLSLSPVVDGDRIEVGPRSKGHLKLYNGSVIQLLPLTWAAVSSLDSIIQLEIKKGSYQIEKRGDFKKLQIIEGQINPGELPAELSDEEINKTMGSHRQHFFKCYTHLLHKSPKLSGSVQLSFAISNTGKVQNANATSQALSDSSFLDCVKEVTLRVQFRAFQGDTTIVNYPIQFE